MISDSNDSNGNAIGIQHDTTDTTNCINLGEWQIFIAYLWIIFDAQPWCLFCMVSQTGDQIGGVTRCDSNRVGETTKMMGTYCYRHMYMYILYISAMMLARILHRFISQFLGWCLHVKICQWLLVEATSPNSSLAAKITVFWDAVHDCTAPPAQQ